MKNEIFPIIILTGRPASGKSEIIDFLTRTPEAERRERFHIGELKILELREKAKQALDDDFDIKEFHDVVLKYGSVPLELLEQFVDEYIQTKSES